LEFNLDKIKSELKEYFPYQVIEVYGTEADDVIAVASKHFTSEKVLIVSNDKDLISLLNTHVSVYRPLTEELYCYKSESKIKGLLIR
jgi:5'-3' exonuclease